MTGKKIKVGTPTTIHGVLEFENGAIVTIGASWDVFSHGHQQYRALRNRRLSVRAGPELLRRRDQDHRARLGLAAARHFRPSVRHPEPRVAERRKGRRLPDHRAAGHGGGAARGPATSGERRSRAARPGGAGRVRALLGRRPPRHDREPAASDPSRCRSAPARTSSSRPLRPEPQRRQLLVPESSTAALGRARAKRA